MDKWGSRIRAVTACERGVAAIEYALLLALIAIAIVASLTNTGARVQAHWNQVDQSMPGGTDFST